MKFSLQSKITFAMWLVSAISTLMAAALMATLLIRSHQQAIRKQLQTAGTTLMTLGISDFSELEDFEVMDSFVQDALKMQRAGTIIRVFDAKLKLVFTSLAIDNDELPETLEKAVRAPTFLKMAGHNFQYETLILPYQVGRKKKDYYLQIAILLPKYSEIVKSIRAQIFLLFSALFLLSLLVSKILARRLSQPIDKIAQHLHQMNPEQIESWKPIRPIPRGQYLEVIVQGLNRLSQKTRHAVIHMRKMSRYVSHELRTPLTILRGEAEMVLQKKEASPEEYVQVLRSSLEEVDRMAQIVNTVLQVAEPAQSKSLNRPVVISLKSWLQENLSSWESSLGRVISLEMPSGVSPEILIDPQLLFRLVDNLIRNVKRHTPAETPCKILLEENGGHFRLVIEDQGPVLAQELLVAMNNPEKLLELRGVGIHLCHSIAQSCGLKLHFVAKEKGGLRVEIGFDSSPSFQQC